MSTQTTKNTKPTTLRQLPAITSLSDLIVRARTEPRYAQLTIIAAQNLGCDLQPGERAVPHAHAWLAVNAGETSEAGVVDEIDSVRDIELEAARLTARCNDRVAKAEQKDLQAARSRDRRRTQEAAVTAARVRDAQEQARTTLLAPPSRLPGLPECLLGTNVTRRALLIGRHVRITNAARVDVIGKIVYHDRDALGLVLTVRVPNWTADGMSADWTARPDNVVASTAKACKIAAQAR